MADKTAQTIYIDADPSTVMGVIADIASYPEWVNEYHDCEVLEAGPGGYPKNARLGLGAAVVQEPRVLAYGWRRVRPRGDGVRGPPLAGALCAALAAYLSVRCLVRFFETNRLTPFAYYCTIAGTLALIGLAIVA